MKVIYISKIRKWLVVISFVSVICLFLFPATSRTEQFIKYKSVDGKFSFDYPSAFVLEVLDFQGGEILNHIAFSDRENNVHGFVQVWYLQEDLKSFLDKSITASHNTYKYFDVINVQSDGMKGYLWDYSVATENGYIKGSEFFAKCGSNMYRLSYFVPEEKWDQKQMVIFEKMLKSFKIICP